MSDIEHRVSSLETRMTAAERRLDTHELVIMRVNEILTYSRNTWLVIKWFGGFASTLVVIATVMRLFGVL